MAVELELRAIDYGLDFIGVLQGTITDGLSYPVYLVLQNSTLKSF